MKSSTRAFTVLLGVSAGAGAFAQFINGSLFGTTFAGSSANGQTIRGSVSQSINWGGGTMTAGARITRPYLSPGTLFQYVDNFAPVVPEPVSLLVLGGSLVALARRRR